jgi:hypothetical protein
MSRDAFLKSLMHRALNGCHRAALVLCKRYGIIVHLF